MSLSSLSNEASIQQVKEWLDSVEGEHFEFKEAKTGYSFEKLGRYCCAMANEGGGKVVLGVTDRRPRHVVGTRAFVQFERTRRALIEKLPLRIEVLEIRHPEGRVLVFDVPPHPVGVPLKYAGVYWCRDGDSLVPLPEHRLRLMFAEAGRDFSAERCTGATLQDLDPASIENFRQRWIKKSKNQALGDLDQEQLLRDAEVILDDGGIAYAALILFGTRAALGRFLGQSEVIFEYRSSDASGPAQERKEYRQGFFSFYDDLWEHLAKRNDLQHYQSGLFVFDVPTFDERAVREAVLNAVSHRDYQLGGSVFLRQYQRRLEVESPGGFPVGITIENVLDRQSPRNRRIADIFAKSGLVERSGQGMNLMFEQSIRQGKRKPDLSGTDAYHVVLRLDGEVSDPQFLRFLERVGREKTAFFGARDLLVLDMVHREVHVPVALQSQLRRLVDLGVVENVGRGRGVRYLLARRFYQMTRRAGAYTRRKGLDHETHKELLVKHLRENPQGAALAVLHQVLPYLSQRKVQSLLQELRSQGRIDLEGKRRWARWKIAKDT